ncbi:DEAD/DEAH box helicase [Lewinellaceae bacterium SD302]|nr:DEAD/DEAH box helicase [Lewinellaceae bacterium SD302]
MKFADLGLDESILKALTATGYTEPTPIQEQSIPILLKGTDLLGWSQTGTGKTAAFAIPIIQQILDNQREGEKRRIKSLVVTPTRELALQIGESFTTYSKFTDLRNTVIFGGVKQGKQVDRIKRGIDVLVATPGRLLDLMGQGHISLRDVEYFVLDEADHMLDMGFIHDIRKLLVKLPDNRQSLFFSATMPKEIVSLAKNILRDDFERVTIKPKQATAERVEQAVYLVAKKDKPELLKHLIKNEEDIESVLVFSRTKHGADKIVRKLKKVNIQAAAIHGNKSQNARQKALGQFKDGDINVLVATDIAARGIDVSELSHVINYDLPNVSETYVHRIGRTGRASASGVALSFCDIEERPYLKDIQKLINQQLPLIKDHPYVDERDDSEIPLDAPKPKRVGGGRGRGGGGGNRNRNRNRNRNGGGGGGRGRRNNSSGSRD